MLPRRFGVEALQAASRMERYDAMQSFCDKAYYLSSAVCCAEINLVSVMYQTFCKGLLMIDV